MNGVVKRSVSINGHRTSFSLEAEFFADLSSLARARRVSLASLVGEVDAARAKTSNLSSALRLHVLDAAKKGELGLLRGADGQTEPQRP